MLTNPTDLRIPVPWGHISALGWGSLGGTPILAIHGWMDNAASFDKLIPLLASKFYVVAIDLPGHGCSSHLPPGSAYHFGDYITTIHRIASHLKWPRFNILGHSMGAGIGLYFAAVYPQMVDRLLMLDMIKPMSSDEGTTPQAVAEGLTEFLKLEERKKAEMEKGWTFEEAVRRWIMGADFNTDGTPDNHSLTEVSTKILMSRGALRVDIDKWSFRHDPMVRCASIYMLSHQQSLQFLNQVKCHLMIIKASQGPTLWGSAEIIRQTLDIYKKNCSSFKYETVHGTHFVHLNEATKVSSLVNEYFSK